jgi:hypothetical protein
MLKGIVKKLKGSKTLTSIPTKLEKVGITPANVATVGGFAIGGPMGAGLARAGVDNINDKVKGKDFRAGEILKDFGVGYGLGTIGTQIPGVQDLPGKYGMGAGAAGAAGGAGGAGGQSSVPGVNMSDGKFSWGDFVKNPYNWMAGINAVQNAHANSRQEKYYDEALDIARQGYARRQGLEDDVLGRLGKGVNPVDLNDLFADPSNPFYRPIDRVQGVGGPGGGPDVPPGPEMPPGLPPQPPQPPDMPPQPPMPPGPPTQPPGGGPRFPDFMLEQMKGGVPGVGMQVRSRFPGVM